MNTDVPFSVAFFAVFAMFGAGFLIGDSQPDARQWRNGIVAPALAGHPIVVDLGDEKWLAVADYAVVTDAEVRGLLANHRAWDVVRRDGGAE